MKKLLRCIGMGIGMMLLTGGLQAQVSTSVEKKSALLEEYTGSGCGNCPDGARMASVIKEVCQDNFYIIAIHAGHYAEPASGFLDLRTPYGDSLLSNATDIGFPSGSINRVPHEGILNMSRALWQEKVKGELSEDAKVNMYVSSEVNAKTRELKVRVEWYYPSPVEVNPQYLHVALLQSNIIGYQNGAGASYSHQHVLRDMFTGAWGDTIRETESGKVYVKEYVKVLPEEISGVDLDIRYLEIVAFITETRSHVMNVTGSRPEIKELKDEVNVTLSEIELGSARYGFAGFPVEVSNHQNDTIRNLTFSVDVNGEEQKVDIDCLISPYGKTEVWVPTSEFDIMNSNEVSLHVTGVNGSDFVSGKVSYAFSSPVVTKSDKIVLDMKTDLHGEEIIYSVKNRNGEILYSNGPFEEGVQHSFIDTIRLEEPGVYAIEFLDYWRDGWQSGKKGSYKIKDSEGTILAQNYSVQGYKNLVFFEVPDNVSTEEPGRVAQVDINVVPVEGGFLLSAASGLQIDRVFVYDLAGRRLMSRPLSTFGNNVFVDFRPSVSGWMVVEVWGNFGRQARKIWLKY